MKKTSLLLLLALLLAALPVGAATLSVRTADGLVVVHGEAADLEALRAELPGALPQDASNTHLLQYIFRTHADKLNAAAYADEQEGHGQASVGSPTVLQATVREAVQQGFIPAIAGTDLYEACMLISMRGDTFMLLGKAPENALDIDRNLFLFSSANGTEIVGIYLDGRKVVPEEIFWNSPNGYKFVVLAPRGDKVIAQAEFDTFSDPDVGQRMADFLDAQPEGAILAAVVKWSPGVFLSGGAIDAMQRYGSAADPDPELHMSHAFIGRKGLPGGQALEASAVQDSSRIIYFSKKTYLDPAQAHALDPAPGSRIIAIQGTAPDDAIYIIGRDY